MNRRDTLFAFLALGAATAHGRSFAQAQRANVARIGVLSAETASSDAMRLDAVRAGLRDLGYVEGKNIVIESRWADGKYDRLPGLAAELVRLKVDVIVTFGTKAALGAKGATTTIPIVMASAGDLVAVGVIDSIARPGGNITGSTNVGVELGSKRLELLRELVPNVTQVAYLLNPDNPAFKPNLQAIRTAARSLALEVQPFDVREVGEVAGVFSQMAKRQINAFILQDETSFGVNAKRIADLASKNRLVSVGNKIYAEAGGLLGYGPDIRALERRAAHFVDRILRGAKAGDLPIEQPTKYELIINRRTARALGLAIPRSLIVRADQVLE